MAGVRISLKLKVALIATLAIVMLAAFMGWQQDRRLGRDFKAVLASQQEALAELMADRLSNELHTYLTVLEASAAQLDEATVRDVPALQRFVSGPSPMKALFDGLALIDLEGRVVVNEPPLPPGKFIDVSDRAYFRRALSEQRSLVSEPLETRTGAGPAILLVVPVRDAKGQVQAFLAGGLRLLRSNLLGQIAQTPVGRTGHFEITTRGPDPVYVIHPDPARVLQRVQDAASGDADAVVTRKLVGQTDWELRVVLPGWEVTAPIQEARHALLQQLALSACALICGLWLVTHATLRPLTRLHHAIRQLRRNPDAAVHIDTRGQDERGDLARDFKGLLDELRTRQQELHLITRASPLGLFRSNADGEIVYANEAYLRMHDLQPQDMARGWLRMLPASQREAAWAAWQDIVRAAQPRHWVRTIDGPPGQPRVLSVHLAPLNLDGEPAGMVGTVEDITQRVQAEDALRTLTSIFDCTADYVLQTDTHGRITYLNPAARRVLGLHPEQSLEGLTYDQFNTPDTNALIATEVLPVLRRQGHWLGETRFIAGDGREVLASHMVIAHRDAHGRIARFSGVLRDITAQALAQQEVQRQAATLRSVAEHLPLLIAVVGADERYRYVNQAYLRWVGRRSEEVVGRTLAEVLGAEEYARSRPWVERALAGQTVSFEKDYSQRRTQRHLSVHYVPLRLEDARIDGFVGMAQDVTEQRQEALRLMNLAHTDPLTGLLNRAGFETALARMVSQGQGERAAVLYVDLDHFKPVNDAHGHAVGDEVLRLFAARVVRLVRPSDVVARLGGDEFAVLLPHIAQLAHAQAVAAKVLEAAHTPFSVSSLTLRISASVGIAYGMAPGEDGAAFLARADAQLYQAKRNGRGRHATATA